MKKIRLLVTSKCNRNCKGCCNKDYDLASLPIFNDQFYQKNQKNIDMIIITGGEPLLFQNKLVDFLIAHHNYKVKWIVYTAFVENYSKYTSFMGLIDGLTLTLHEQSDVIPAKQFMSDINLHMNKSLILKVFDGIDISSLSAKHLLNWNIKQNIEWIKNCPLPKDEIFMKLPILW